MYKKTCVLENDTYLRLSSKCKLKNALGDDEHEINYYKTIGRNVLANTENLNGNK